MKLNKQIIIILVLGALLLSAVGSAYYFYMQNTKALATMSQKVKVFVLNKDVQAGHQILDEDLKVHTMTRSELLYTPLSEKEIVGKFTLVDMYTNEAIIKEKITSVFLEKKVEIKHSYKNNSYNMAYKLFENPNYTLQIGDIINIISIYPDQRAEETNAFSVQYVDKNIEVLGFVYDGVMVPTAISKQTITQVIDKKRVETELDAKADEILLDIEDEVLLRLIEDYNKGRQLWMVQTRLKEKAPSDGEIESVVADSSSDDGKGTHKIKKLFQPAIEYKYRWYVPINKTGKKIATIEYSNEEDSQVESIDIEADYTQNCQNKETLIVTKGKVYLRIAPDAQSQAKTILGQKAIIPYSHKIGEWYQTCDDLYIHDGYVEELSYEEAVNNINEEE
ncbi:MAG: SAF domain-containing protein [Arcobacteraceae bacterium]|jgi:hypothetical protein|nr:SAF domain-containing protein [Arcobacteraceae bacterium]MDY0365581.1 SAF domain-containing protein [Arcobacteraceae bacterium]